MGPQSITPRLLMLAGLLWTAHYTWSSSRSPADWEPFDYFIGKWRVEPEASPRDRARLRQYSKIMGGRLLCARDVSETRAGEGEDRASEAYVDWSFVSYDDSSSRFVLREFHPEGHVSRYRLRKDSESGRENDRRLVFESVTIGNLPVGWRGRRTLRIESEDVFTEHFELAAPDDEFQTIVKNRWVRDYVDPAGG